MIKKSVSLHGHRTSLVLEKEFWESLDKIKARENLSLPGLLEKIDEKRQLDRTNLASAIRVFVLRYEKSLGAGESESWEQMFPIR